jgi:hypothetical protein
MHLRFALLASWLPILEYVLFRTAYLSLFAIIIVGSCMRYSCVNCGFNIGNKYGNIFKFGEWLNQVDQCSKCGNPL